MKKYNSAPLPFQGQKRRFNKEFRTALHNFKDATLFVDLFGGSGLLSHIVKCERPDARVVYNDFDIYSQRLQHIDLTNQLLANIRVITDQYPRLSRLPAEAKQAILDVVAEAETAGYVDYVTLSANLLFSSKYVTDLNALRGEGFYSKTRYQDYDTAESYLEGIEVVSSDYKDIFEQYKDVEGVVFLVDPPYLSTDVSSYKCYWRLKDYLDVLTVIGECSYFYFTSNKSEVVELCEWISEAKVTANPFKDAVRTEVQNQVNHTSKYTDIMLYRV